jgi:hypothetical protein
MKCILVAAAALALLGAAPAAAQYGGYGGGYGGGYRGGWDDDDDDWRDRRRRRGWDEGPRYERRMSMGSLCLTSRGNCRTRPAPPNTPCGCDIPGFGYKRGAVGGGGGY